MAPAYWRSHAFARNLSASRLSICICLCQLRRAQRQGWNSGHVYNLTEEPHQGSERAPRARCRPTLPGACSRLEASIEDLSELCTLALLLVLEVHEHIAPVRSMLEDRLSPLLYVRRLVAFVTQTEVAMTGGDYHGCCRLLVGPLYRGPHSWP